MAVSGRGIYRVRVIETGKVVDMQGVDVREALMSDDPWIEIVDGKAPPVDAVPKAMPKPRAKAKAKPAAES